MKTFTSILLLAASVASVSAQVSYNSTTGTFSCPVPNGAYCAGDSLKTNIIIRCVDGVGQPGNCNDNLAGDYPQGVSFSPCWAPTANSSEAACSKNCVVYGESGNYNGTFTLPNCTPEVSPTSNVPTSTAVVTSCTTICSGCAQYPTAVSTGTVPHHNSTSLAVVPPPTMTTTSGFATATPVGPTGTTQPVVPTYTGAAVVNTGTFLAGVGLIAAWFL